MGRGRACTPVRAPPALHVDGVCSDWGRPAGPSGADTSHGQRACPTAYMGHCPSGVLSYWGMGQPRPTALPRNQAPPVTAVTAQRPLHRSP